MKRPHRTHSPAKRRADAVRNDALVRRAVGEYWHRTGGVPLTHGKCAAIIQASKSGLQPILRRVIEAGSVRSVAGGRLIPGDVEVSDAALFYRPDAWEEELPEQGRAHLERYIKEVSA